MIVLAVFLLSVFSILYFSPRLYSIENHLSIDETPIESIEVGYAYASPYGKRVIIEDDYMIDTIANELE
ncbi:MAG: hypothetical protein IJF28_03365, partial [Firmicutes bacterium]|nr:hypothetical protein [Bacillota bacterium]